MRSIGSSGFAALILAATCAGLSACSGEGPPVRPNVILISIDTLRANHLGAYGYPLPTSPELDRIAQSGLVFENAASTAPWTSPAHATMLTGLYPSRHGVKEFRHQLDAGVHTLAEVLQAQGFATGAVVSNANVGQGFGFDRGFESFALVPERHHLESSGVIEEGMTWLEERDPERPFFLFLHLFDLHNPYGAKPEYEKEFVAPYDGKITGDAVQLIMLGRGKEELDEGGLAYVVQTYDAGIRQLDHDIGRLHAYLAAQGLLDTSLIVITSDHGEEFMDHGKFLHAYSHYQELLQVPLIMRGPGIPSGRRIAEPVSLVDLMPTTLSLLGIEPDFEMNGVDLRALWGVAGAPALPERTLFSEADQTNRKPDIRRSARRGRYKLLYNTRTRRIELYDLAVDPSEQNDIAAQQPELRRQLLQDLEDFMSQGDRTGETRTLTPARIEELKRLGYIQE